MAPRSASPPNTIAIGSRAPSPSENSASGKQANSIIGGEIANESWFSEGLVIVVIGASGDLAKKKTYPSILNLYDDNLLPPDTIIWGYARSKMSHDDLRAKLKPYLMQTGHHSEHVVDDFLSRCFYQSGKSYGDLDAYATMVNQVSHYENRGFDNKAHNRLFYFAIPPNVFGESGVSVKKVAMADKGWTRVIIEKPFGRDLASCEELTKVLSDNFEEHHMYRIDHYLGKEMVQNLLVLRFGNSFFQHIWHKNAIASVVIDFKEPFGTEGRGGYFDKYGIIRDVIQNHLLQVLMLIAMEPPVEVDGVDAGDLIRDAKVQVLDSIPAIKLEDCVLGQYEGYTDDPTIEDKGSRTPTFAAVRCFVQTPRWAGVPFILRAGKNLDERKCEVRIQLRDAPSADFLFHSKCPRNELVLRLQPNEAIYMKTNIKSPGFSSVPIQSDLEINYDDQFHINKRTNPDAYTRLVLDVLRGRHAAFVRDDELKRSWEIFTPLLHVIDEKCIEPFVYQPGTTGPMEADAFIASKCNYIKHEDPVDLGNLLRKSSL